MSRQRLRFLDDALGVVLDEAQSAISSSTASSSAAVAPTAPERGSGAGGGRDSAGGALGSSGGGNHSSARAAEEDEPARLAQDLRMFTQSAAAAIDGVPDEAEAAALRARLADFAITLMGGCLAASTAAGSRDAGPTAAGGGPPSLASLLHPAVLRDVAAGQLQALPALGIGTCDALTARLAALQGAEEEEGQGDAASLGAAVAVTAAYCAPEGRLLQKPAGADAQLSLALATAEVRSCISTVSC